MSYKIYFVDIDDTILDFQKSSLASFEESMKELGLQHQWPALYKTFKSVSHQLWKDYELGLVDRIKVRYERFIQTFELHQIDRDPRLASKLYLDNLCTYVFYVDGALELLEKIKQKGSTLGFITNGISSVQERRIKGSPIEPLMDFMVVSEDCEAPKPHISMFNKAFELSAAASKKEILMLGDSLSSDIQGSLNFGIDCCWYNPNKMSPGLTKPTYQIQSLPEFNAYL